MMDSRLEAMADRYSRGDACHAASNEPHRHSVECRFDFDDHECHLDLCEKSNKDCINKFDNYSGFYLGLDAFFSASKPLVNDEKKRQCKQNTSLCGDTCW